MNEINATNNIDILSSNVLALRLYEKRNELSEKVYNYLKRLINLEESALDENAIFSELKEVSSSDLFVNIVTYNIYALAFEYSKTHADIYLDDQINNVKLKVDNNRVFEFYYDKGYDQLPSREVNLFKKVYDPEYNEMLDEMLTKQIEEEYKKVNPYGEVHTSYRSSSSDWQYQRQLKIDKLNKELKDLRDHDIPNDEEKKELETLEIFNQSLIDYFKIKEEGFEEAKSYGDLKRKTLTKKVNNVKVFNNIRYI